MSAVTLVSGGLDSTVMAHLVREEGMTQFPLFIDYGQRNLEKEQAACFANFQNLGLPRPKVANLGGYGQLLPCGLTDSAKHVTDDAFLPGRNLMFLTVGAAYAYQHGATVVAIGLLDDAYSIFPDQERKFLVDAESLLSIAMNRQIKVVAPLISFCKAEVLEVAKLNGISKTYSCHVGSEPPCGDCIACREYTGLEV